MLIFSLHSVSQKDNMVIISTIGVVRVPSVKEEIAETGRAKIIDQNETCEISETNPL